MAHTASTGWEVDVGIHWPKWCYQLRSEDAEVTRSLRALFNDKWASRQSGIGPDRLRIREHDSVKQLIPDGEGEAEVDILWPIEFVVNAVIVRTDEDSSKRSKAKVGIGVRERHDPAVRDEQHRRQRTVRNQDDPRHKCNQIGDMDERVRPKHR